MSQTISATAQPSRIRVERWADVFLGSGLAVLFSVLYGQLALTLIRGHFLDAFNLLFDMDPPAFLRTYQPPPGFVQAIDMGIKHPLATWLGVFSDAWAIFGLDRPASAALASATVGGMATAVLFAFARRLGAMRIDAVLIALVFGFGATHLFSSMIIESYPYAALSLAIMWYLAAIRTSNPTRHRPAAVASAVATFGITMTNVVQSMLVEIVLQFTKSDLRTAIRRVFFFGCAVAIVAAIAILVTWPREIGWIALHPIAASKQLYWQIPRTPKTGLGPVLLTFLGFSLAAPRFTSVPLPNDGIVMHDFRAFDMPTIETAGLAIWLCLLCFLAAAAIRNPKTRVIGATLLAVLLFNLCLHMWIQYRQSIFLYTEHLWIAIAGVAAAGLAALNGADMRLRTLARAALITVLVTVAPNNLERARNAAHFFDKPESLQSSALALEMLPGHDVDARRG